VDIDSVQAFFQSPETVIHVIEGAGMVALAFIGLKIQNAVARMELNQAKGEAKLLAHQQEVKDDLGEKHDELVANQTSLRIDFDQKHAENRQQLAVHIADDRGNFEVIKQLEASNSATLARIEGKLNGH
jgi:uncharacterized protein involved in exopolysaccharide biosynthesis